MRAVESTRIANEYDPPAFAPVTWLGDVRLMFGLGRRVLPRNLQLVGALPIFPISAHEFLVDPLRRFNSLELQLCLLRTSQSNL